MSDPMIEALLLERLGYERRGLTDRVAEVDEQLAARGYTKAVARSEERVERAVTTPPQRRKHRA